jgi:hypothetical protein
MREESPIAEPGIGGHAKVSASSATSLQKIGILAGRFRWVICGLLFLGVTKNYMDRQVLGANPGDLRHFGRWKHRRRLAILEYDQARIFRECCAEVDDAFLCFGRSADCHCLPHHGIVARHTSDWPCSSRTSGFFRKSLYVDIRSLPFPSGRVRGRYWWHGWGDWRHADR